MFASSFEGLRCLRHFSLLHVPGCSSILQCSFSQCSQGRTDCSLLPAPCSQLPWEFLSHLGISSATSLSFGTGAVSARGSQGGAQQCSLTRLWTPGQTVCHYSPDGFSLKSPLLTPHSSDLSLPSPKDPGQGLSPCSSAQNQQEQGFSAVIFA